MPYWRSRLRTGLSPAEVSARLSALTLAPEDAYLGLPLRKGRTMAEAATADDGFEFVGHVTEREFRLNRQGPFDAAFRPELHGRVAAAPDGATIELTQRIPWLAVLVVMSLVCAGVFVPTPFWPDAGPTGSIWPPSMERALFVAVVAAMIVGGYAQDAVRNRRRLAALLDASVEARTPPKPPTVRR